ncbi:phage tail assembly chaperone [Pseudochrobactrum asaccharolyticum]|uniref:phage tail assembly chaperone n=1 Tax=Pseudochrobactrum asaccharolyticum TaxID=354351 RepID=UPI003CCAEEEC
MCTAVRDHIRYDTPDHNGETRRQRYARVDEPSPHIVIPLAGSYLWEWFFDLSNMRQEADKRISVADYDAWSRLTGRGMKPFEFKILKAMDEAYISSFRGEIRDNQARIDRHNEAAARMRGR